MELFPLKTHLLLPTQCPSSCLLCCYLMNDIPRSVPNMLSGLRKLLYKMKRAVIRFLLAKASSSGWTTLLEPPPREGADVYRKATKTGRVLGYPCDLYPQREIILVA